MGCKYNLPTFSEKCNISGVEILADWDESPEVGLESLLINTGGVIHLSIAG